MAPQQHLNHTISSKTPYPKLEKPVLWAPHLIALLEPHHPQQLTQTTLCTTPCHKLISLPPSPHPLRFTWSAGATLPLLSSQVSTYPLPCPASATNAPSIPRRPPYPPDPRPRGARVSPQSSHVFTLRASHTGGGCCCWGAGRAPHRTLSWWHVLIRSSFATR